MPRDKVQFVLDLLHLKKISYGDVRFVDLKCRTVSAKNGRPSLSDAKASSGIGIRVLKKGAWGFACTPDLTKKRLESAVTRAIATAEAASRIRNRPIILAKESPIRATWKTRAEIDPWQVDPQEQMNYLLACEEEMRRDKRILVSESRMEFTKKAQIFASTEGSFIESQRILTGAGMFAKAFGRHEVQKRSYPSPSKDYQSRGYEAILDLGMKENAARIREEALRLLTSPACPAKTLDLILRDSILALQIHESIGHAAELDRVYGYEDNFGGRTYLRPEGRGRLRVGSREVTMAANRAEETEGAGFAAYDDEGTPARETVIVEEGVFKGYLSSRETAHFLKLPHASGSMIAEDWSHFPMIRMTNLSLAAGGPSFEELLSAVDEGILMDTESSWSIDEERGDFQIGGEIAWHVKKGKVVGAFKNPLYRGESLQFWKKCRAVAASARRISGFADCGKGGPYQQAFVSHGCSPALFRGVECYASGK